MATELKEYTKKEVSEHNTEQDCWLIIGNANTGGPKVYDVTPYLDDHPGGGEVLMDAAGTNADDLFEDIGHSSDAREELKKLLVGTLKLTEEEKAEIAAEAERKAVAKQSGGNGFIIVVVLIAILAAYFKTMM